MRTPPAPRGRHIPAYEIEENETLNVIIRQCYQRLKQTNINDGNTIEKLICDLILNITDDKIGDDKSAIIINICQKIGIKAKDMQNKLVILQDRIDQHEKTIVELKSTVDGLQAGNETLKDHF